MIFFLISGFNPDYKAYLICLGITLLVANTAASFGTFTRKY